MTLSDASQPASGRHQVGRDWLAEAEEAYGAGEGKRAIYAAREASAQNPHDPRPWELRARSSFALGRYGDAEFEAKEAIGLAPRVATHYELLAGVYEVQERYDEALAEIMKAVRLEPHQPMYRGVLGSIHVSRGAPADAVPIFERLVSDEPAEPLYQRGLAVALDDAATSRWTHLPDGSSVITSATQAAQTREAATRGLAMTFNDDGVRRRLGESLAAADAAERRRWRRPRDGRIYAVAIFVLIVVAISCTSAGGNLLPIGLLALLCLAGVVWLFVARHYKPAWTHDAAVARTVLRGGGQ